MPAVTIPGGHPAGPPKTSGQTLLLSRCWDQGTMAPLGQQLRPKRGARGPCVGTQVVREAASTLEIWKGNTGG